MVFFLCGTVQLLGKNYFNIKLFTNVTDGNINN